MRFRRAARLWPADTSQKRLQRPAEAGRYGCATLDVSFASCVLGAASLVRASRSLPCAPRAACASVRRRSRNVRPPARPHRRGRKVRHLLAWPDRRGRRRDASVARVRPVRFPGPQARDLRRRRLQPDRAAPAERRRFRPVRRRPGVVGSAASRGRRRARPHHAHRVLARRPDDGVGFEPARVSAHQHRAPGDLLRGDPLDPPLVLGGHLLSLYETSDAVGSCAGLAARSRLDSFKEIAVSTGKSHGAFFQPLPVWVGPLREWIASTNR